MKDDNFKIVARDSLNWAKMPINAKMDNPKSKWNSVVIHTEYLPEALKMLEMTIETQTILNTYNESLEAFKQQNQWKFQDDFYTIDKQNREWTILKNGSFNMCSQDKNRLKHKLFEVFLKTDVMNAVTITTSLKSITKQGE